ncbi:LolA family protein [Geoalkalibacter halelectricus]|uniref:Outer membrane lipoprotein carrier protein LolA n=1 Tax=Geoalkalibacter halelectricus TaxID=2847045 RepID=A0ABY5ZQR4_9BACT|nr:outer membrane lipoprotein carrier protein LolA [Geoalkalibacter halelectricus]MDO3378393.1 outer membrane lipoprotein carrier protein LolA [Geoalkalibacter halelectricus]UWZ80287.1 outer membrane lipoprotein carrier protein LolA [Geoalkalibacter halelectricus]
MRKLSFFVFLCLLWPLSVGAAPRQVEVGLADVIQALESPFQPGRPDAGIVDFEAEFFQESRILALDRAQRGRGQVWFKFDRALGDRVPQAKFRWEYRQPTEQEIVSDGRTLWVYLPENNQVIESDIEFALREQPDNPVTFLTGLGNLSRDFSIRWAAPNRDPAGNYILELQPRRTSQLIARLLIVVDQNAVLAFDSDLRPALRGAQNAVFPILSTTVTDPNGNSTIIEFSSMRVNRGLPDSLFQFIRPADVEVVRPSGLPGF